MSIVSRRGLLVGTAAGLGAPLIRPASAQARELQLAGASYDLREPILREFMRVSNARVRPWMNPSTQARMDRVRAAQVDVITTDAPFSQYGFGEQLTQPIDISRLKNWSHQHMLFRDGRVLLVTDSMHALPAQVVRNGVRVMVEGEGRIDVLDVNHVASTMDVRPGDLLVSSGLGQRFPGGYPVGVVESVTNDPGKPFAVVVARPSAQLDRSRHVLVVTEGEASVDAASSEAAPSGTAQEPVDAGVPGAAPRADAGAPAAPGQDGPP